MADSNQQGGSVPRREGILYSEHEYTARSEHPYEFPQVLHRKTLWHMPESNVAVDEREVCIGEWQSSIGVEHISAMCVPMMIKIDTEGSEIWVCQGAKRLLAQNRPALIVATHPKWLPDGQKIEDLFALLSGYGYRVAASDTLQCNTADFRDYLFLAE